MGDTNASVLGSNIPPMTDSPWWGFLDARLRERGWKPADLSRASGVSEGRISEWKNRGAPPTIANARAVAAALSQPLLDVLVEAGLLTRGEARQSLSAYTTRELCSEIAERYETLSNRNPL